jgi:hypothetical protein
VKSRSKPTTDKKHESTISVRLLSSERTLLAMAALDAGVEPPTLAKRVLVGWLRARGATAPCRDPRFQSCEESP